MLRSQIFDRTARLLGNDGLECLDRIKVIIFGVGGVGSWAAETLVRTGITHVTIVDADKVAASNVNRQLPALVSTVGQVKVDVLSRHLLDINPEASVTALHTLYNASTASSFSLEEYDYVIDAIDSLSDKALLILNATEAMSMHKGMKLFSSMGAALKLDPSRIAVDEFWKVKGCPLAAALRRKFKKSGRFPARKFKCVYSDELVPNSPAYEPAATEDGGMAPMSFNKAVTNGSLMHITSIFGITLASLVIRDAISRHHAF
ncbi:MAG: tRNA threonylcarbamoyladenosine dehydratase [Muribaculaceae bacterium]|nr:tRNA threonylcarbamoyladenosine dehydratase [Muribaculaceae bacterium]